MLSHFPEHPQGHSSEISLHSFIFKFSILLDCHADLFYCRAEAVKNVECCGFTSILVQNTIVTDGKNCEI